MPNRNAQIIAVVGIIIAALLGYKLYIKSPGAAGNTVERGWQALVNAQGAHIAATLDLTLPTTMRKINQPIVNVTIKTEGDADWRNQSRYVGTFSIETKGRGMQLFADGELHILPEKTLFKLHNLPTILNPSGNLLDKWNNVDVALLKVTNSEQVTPALTSFFADWQRTGRDAGSKLDHFEKTVTAEEAQRLEQVFNFQASGGEALHILARILKHLTIDKAEVWVDPANGQLRQLAFHGRNPNKPENEATLKWQFTDYGKEVSADTPEAEANIKPDVFSQLFGEPKPATTPSPTPKRK